MRERNVGSVVLVEGGRPVGFITDRDLALSVAGRRARPADHGVRPRVHAGDHRRAGHGASTRARDLMIRHGVRRLVVVEAGLLVGVVTLDDLASRDRRRALPRELSARVTRAAMPDYFFHERGGG